MVGKGTMFEQTLERVRDPGLFSSPLVVGAASQAGEIEKLAPETRLILEPVPRGSAAAIALAAFAADDDVVQLVLPSDHYVTDPGPLYDAIRRGLPAAESGSLITFGIQPGQAETGYGYITGGKPISEGVVEARSFVEKPTKEIAHQLIDSGSAYWNSGMFMFSAGAMRRELKRHAPEIYAAAAEAMQRSTPDDHRICPDLASLENCPNTSIDYAVMEHSDRIALVPVQLDWSDVGSWAAVYGLASKDAHGNVVSDGSRAIGSSNCLIRSNGPQIVTIGVEKLIVIATPDHVLVVPLSDAQRVREAAELVKRL
jgi:mannose-1-phosphate guanylyltransferase